MIDEMYRLFNFYLPDYKGKICIPLSGGLDSRVIAGLVANRRPIDLAFTQFELKYPIKIGKDIKFVSYARDIVKALGIKRHIVVNVNNESQQDLDAVYGLPDEHILVKSKMYTGLRLLGEQVDLSEYTFILGHGLDSLTGIAVNGIHNRYKHDVQTRIKRYKYFTAIFDCTYGKFGQWSCPLWNDEIEYFFYTMPYRYRFMQYGYRQMINKYFPDLARIKREGMNCRLNISETRYICERLKYYLRKSLKLRE